MVQVNVRRKLDFRFKIKRYVAVLFSVTVTVAVAFTVVHNYHFHECTSNCQSKQNCAREKKEVGDTSSILKSQSLIPKMFNLVGGGVRKLPKLARKKKGATVRTWTNQQTKV